MANLTWGDLAKNAESAQLITEAIQELIDIHNADPDAHLGEGQSLQSHRASEIIDHLALSIVSDKINNGQLFLYHFNPDRFFVPISPKDLDISGMGGSSFAYPVYAELTTNTTANVFYIASTGGDEEFNKIGAPELSPHFRIRVLPKSITSQYLFWGIGTDPTDSFVGYIVDNGTLKAAWCDSYPTQHLISLSGVDISIPHNYEVQAYYNDRVDWLVDGVVVATIPWSDGPYWSGGNTGISFGVKKTTSTLRTLIVYQIILEQDYF